MTRRQHRYICLALLFCLGLALIGTGQLPYRIGGIPMTYAGPAMGVALLIVMVLGILGVNVWAGGPFDAQLDETAGPAPSESERARIRAIYLLLAPSALVLMVMDGFFG